MNAKHLRVIGILLGIALLLYLPTLLRDEEGRGSVRVEDAFAFRVADPITRVDIIDRSAGDTTRLERGVAGWTMNGLRADSAKVDDLLPVLADLESTDLVARNPSNHGSLGVADDTGHRIEVYTESGGPLAFLLGDRDLSAGGYFVREPGADPVFRLEGPAGGYLHRERDGWRPRVIARVDTARVRDILIRRGDEELVLQRDGGAWAVDGVPADSTAVQEMISLLPALSVTGFPTAAEAEAVDFDAPDAEIDVFSEDEGDVTGRSLVMALRLVEDPEAGDWIVKHADGSEVYRLAAYTVRRLLPEDLTP